MPWLHPRPARAHPHTSPSHGGGQRFSESQGAGFLFQTFSFLFLACNSKLDKLLINLKTLPRIYWIPEQGFSGSQRSMQPQTPVNLLSVVNVLERRFRPLPPKVETLHGIHFDLLPTD